MNDTQMALFALFSVLTASAIGAYKLTPKETEEELFLPY
jgi:hypothetical protein|tara:strand:- start:1012 stop:1128 length:117 start_codon:yes stop_codon:yes gene_type:complete